MAKRWSKRNGVIVASELLPEQAEQVEDKKPKPEGGGCELFLGPMREKIRLIKEKLRGVLFGAESLPNGVESFSRGEHTVCDIRVDGPQVQIIRIEMDVFYKDLINVSSKEKLDQFKHNHIDGLCGAEEKLPYVPEALELLEEYYRLAA